MTLLLDTHTFLWFIDDSPQLSQKGKALLEADNALLLSIASLWEIAIKLSLGKLTVKMPTEMLMTQQLTRNDIDVLPITVAHLLVVSTLPLMRILCSACGRHSSVGTAVDHIGGDKF